jgi:ABC-type Zn uptake system ZnuABC Zn-binding protein ZnuA
MRYSQFLLLVAAVVLIVHAGAGAAINVVTTTPDLAEFVRAVGGDQVEVYSINRGDRDPHYVEVRPSYMLKVRQAEVLFKIGMELDLWIDGIIDGSRNNQLRIVDCSEHIVPLEVPGFKTDARHGDLHRFGNPHYWLDPANVAPLIETITRALGSIDPEHVTLYNKNAAAYLDGLHKRQESWAPYLEQVRDKKIIFYHNTWPYFTKFAGLVAVDHVEPQPGIPPSPGHIRRLIETINAGNIEVIAVEPYFDLKVPRMLAEKTGARVVIVCPSVGGVSGVDSYAAMIEHNLRVLAGGTL